MSPVLALAVAACSAAPSDTDGTAPPGDLPGPGTPGGTIVELTRFRPDSLSYSLFSGFDRAERLVIADSEAWQAAWHTLHHHLSPAPPLPAVDFSRDLVVAVTQGRQPSGGYAIRVESAQETEGAVVVQVLSLTPAPDCAVAAVITAPVDLVRLPRGSLPVVFRESSSQQPCG